MTWSLDFAPLVPPTVLWVAIAAAAILVAVLARRRTRGVVWRALALAALVVALANPTLERRERDSLANIAVVVLDESASQQIAGRPRISEAVKAELEARLGKLEALEVRWVRSTRAGGATAGGAGTNLFSDLNKALANVPTDRIAGVVMVTDGQVHDVPKSAAALGFDAPVHALLTGRPDEFDRRIEILKAPRYGIVGEKRESCDGAGSGPMDRRFRRVTPRAPARADRATTIEFRVVEDGRRSAPGATARVRIRREGRSDEVRQVEIGRVARTEMDFAHAGQNVVEIEVDEAPGELTFANNRAVVAAEGVRENLKVLLVSGEPHAGERVWRNLLKSDAAVDLVHFTILRPPEKQDGTPIWQLSLIAFPTRELFSEKINCFDLIIFDRYQHRGILPVIYYDNIARYVEERGGALLLAAGDDYAGQVSLYRTPLAPVLPAAPSGRILETPFKARITGDGARHPVTRGLPGGEGREPTWGRWFRQVDTRAERGRTLMSGAEEKPLLVLDRRGKGRVAMLLSDHAWLWSRGFEGGGPHTDLLRRLSHWLMREPDLEEERLLATAKGLRISVERRTMGETVEPVVVQHPGGENTRLTLERAGPGIWRGGLDVRLPGLYKLSTVAAFSNTGDSRPPEQRTLTAVAHAGVDDEREMREVVTTDKQLAALVAETGGGVFWTRSAGITAALGSGVEMPRISMLRNARVLAGSGWMGLKDRDAHVTRGVSLTPLFTGVLALLALIAALAMAWWREGR
jgi:hypothetical protein